MKAPMLQVQSRINGLIVALPNHKNITGLAKHFKSKGDNELVFAVIKASRAKPEQTDLMLIGSPAEDAESTAPKKRRKAQQMEVGTEDLI